MGSGFVDFLAEPVVMAALSFTSGVFVTIVWFYLKARFAIPQNAIVDAPRTARTAVRSLASDLAAIRDLLEGEKDSDAEIAQSLDTLEASLERANVQLGKLVSAG